MARVLGVSVPGFYAWRSRPASAHATSDAALRRRIRTIHAASHGTYGAPRVQAELQAEGTAVARKRVARLMRDAGLRGISRRRFPTTTQREPSHRPANDLVGRDFRAVGPNRLWVADITYVPTAAGFLFLAIVLDVWSRRLEMQRSGREPFDRLGRRCVRQRHGRGVFRHPRVRAAGSAQLPLPGRGSNCGVRRHRRLLQFDQATLDLRVSLTHRIRSQSHGRRRLIPTRKPSTEVGQLQP